MLKFRALVKRKDDRKIQVLSENGVAVNRE